MSHSSPEKVRKAAATIARDCLAMRVRYLNRSLTSIYDDAFRDLGITASQGNMLVAVVQMGETSPSELGRVLNIEKSTLSRNLERMRKAGWLERRDSSPGNTHSIQATSKGRDLLLEILPLWKEAQKSAKRLLGNNGAESLRAVADHARNEISIA